MKRTITLLAVFGVMLMSALAEKSLDQVFILNEGYYDWNASTWVELPSLGVYDPLAKTYTKIEDIPEVGFTSDIIVDDNYVYVAADTLLIRYDKQTHQRLNMTTIKGIRKLAIWNDLILVSRGDVVNFNSYFQVYDKTSLVLQYELDTIAGPKYASEGLIVRDNKAYIAVNNGFDYIDSGQVGFIGIIDLNQESYVNEHDLGVDGINPDNLMISGDKLYTLNNKHFDGSSISSFDISSSIVVTTDLALSSGCGTSVFANQSVYYQEMFGSNLAQFSVDQNTTVGAISDFGNLYGLENDEVNEHFLATATDYFSYGKLFTTDYDGTILDSVDVGISPGNIALDYKTVTSVQASEKKLIQAVWPNPAKNLLNIELTQDNSQVQIFNALGQELITMNLQSGVQQINTSTLVSGYYIVKVAGNSATRFVITE